MWFFQTKTWFIGMALHFDVPNVHTEKIFPRNIFFLNLYDLIWIATKIQSLQRRVLVKNISCIFIVFSSIKMFKLMYLHNLLEIFGICLICNACISQWTHHDYFSDLESKQNEILSTPDQTQRMYSKAR